MPAKEWGTEEHAGRYLKRADDYPHRAEADAALLEQVPREAHRILDLGTGDSRVLRLLSETRPEMTGVGLDISAPMLKTARERAQSVREIELVEHDLSEPLPATAASRTAPRRESRSSSGRWRPPHSSTTRRRP